MVCAGVPPAGERHGGDRGPVFPQGGTRTGSGPRAGVGWGGDISGHSPMCVLVPEGSCKHIKKGFLEEVAFGSDCHERLMERRFPGGRRSLGKGGN